MTIKTNIINLYYEEHSKPSSIANQLNIHPSYVTKIIKTDTRYNQEKEYRKKQSEEKHKECKRNWIRNKRQNDYNKQLDDFVKQQHIQAAQELSYAPALSDYAYFKWNSSAYHTNSKGNLIIDKKLKVGYDVPKSITMNIKIPTQKYKNKYTYSV